MSKSNNANLSRAIGIDLGTTHSCVGIFRNGKVDIAVNDVGARVTPSMVAFTEKDTYIGVPAKNVMNRYSKSTIYDSKRLIGRKFKDPIVQEDIKYWPFEVISDNEGRPKYNINKNILKKYHL